MIDAQAYEHKESERETVKKGKRKREREKPGDLGASIACQIHRARSPVRTDLGVPGPIKLAFHFIGIYERIWVSEAL